MDFIKTAESISILSLEQQIAELSRGKELKNLLVKLNLIHKFNNPPKYDVEMPKFINR